MQANSQKQWMALARRGAIRFNLGWWLQEFLPWVIGLGLLVAVLILAVRSLHAPVAPIVFGAGAAVVFAAFVAFLKAKAKFMSMEDAMVALEADLRLHNALTSASAGILEWPEPRADARLHLPWNLRAAGMQTLGVVMAILAAILLPLPAQSVSQNVAGQPAAWEAMKQRIEEVKAAEIVEPAALEELETALQALREKPGKDWFSHESLETTDHLQDSSEAALTELGKNLEAALGAMDVSRQLEAAQMEALSPGLQRVMTEALKGLSSGAMPLNEKMLSDLKGLDPSTLRQLSAKDWEKIKAKMSQGISTCSKGFSSGEKAGDALLAAVLGSNGGISRGPGSAPLALKDSETNLKSQSTERMENADLSHAAMGDLVGMGTGEHEVDESAAGSAGVLAKPNAPGDAVSGLNASPSEQKVLQQFFR